MTAQAPDALRLVPVEVAQHAANNMRIAFHKTRLTREVMVSPDDLSVVLDFVLQTASPAVQPAAGREEMRAVIDAATDAVLPPVCDTTGNGTQTRAKMQVEIADRILAALSAPQAAPGEGEQS